MLALLAAAAPAGLLFWLGIIAVVGGIVLLIMGRVLAGIVLIVLGLILAAGGFSVHLNL